MMKLMFDYVYVTIGYDYLRFNWGCDIGFGELETNFALEILDDEFMGKEFTEQVIEEGLKTLRKFLDIRGGDLKLDT